MGTRIHKVMGWGAKHPNREELSFRLHEIEQQGEVNALLEAHIARMKENNSDDFAIHELKIESLNYFPKSKESVSYPKYFNEIVLYADYPDDEDGYHVIVPPMMFKRWYRFDDDMDFIEERQLSEDLETRIVPLKGPPYPYINWMDKDGNVVPLDRIRFGRDRETDEEYYPYVPTAIILIAEHLKFPDWKTLRPMLITWWS